MLIGGIIDWSRVAEGAFPCHRSRSQFGGCANALVDPTLELHDISGTLIASNDNWKTNQQARIETTRLTPGDDRDAAILARLQPGDYTAIVRGSGGTTGVALVEAYVLD